MILFKKWANQNLESYVYGPNQFLREKRHKKSNQ